MSFFALFPGQGSQSVGMKGGVLVERAESVLGFSLSKLMSEGPEAELTNTAIAQPAILTASVAAYREWIQKGGEAPSVAAGHSLGEYSALVAAGAITFEAAVEVVHLRGKFMQEAVPVGEGGMIAVLGRSESEVEELLKNDAEIANVNAPGQIVIAGSTVGLARFTERAKEQKVKIIPLAVSAPFHSSLMKPAQEKLAKVLAELEIDEPEFPVISNVTARATSSPEEIRALLIQQVCGRVRWVESVEEALKEYNVEKAIEFGNGSVLSGLLKKINPEFPRENYSL